MGCLGTEAVRHGPLAEPLLFFYYPKKWLGSFLRTLFLEKLCSLMFSNRISVRMINLISAEKKNFYAIAQRQVSHLIMLKISWRSWVLFTSNFPEILNCEKFNKISVSIEEKREIYYQYNWSHGIFSINIFSSSKMASSIRVCILMATISFVPFFLALTTWLKVPFPRNSRTSYWLL